MLMEFLAKDGYLSITVHNLWVKEKYQIWDQFHEYIPRPSPWANIYTNLDYTKILNNTLFWINLNNKTFQ